MVDSARFRLEINKVEKFKLYNFIKDNDGIAFPQIDSLSPQECIELRLKLCSRFNLKTDRRGYELALTIDRLQTCLKEVRADDPNFDLEKVLRSISVTSGNDVFVNWKNFEIIDRIKIRDLSKFFSDIWYPSTDDIDVFDSSVSWVLSVNHEGEIRSMHF